MNYTDGVTLVGLGPCGDFELATGAWPASGEGTAVTWNVAQTSFLTDVYWFAGYNYYAPTPASFGVGPHPTQGGFFADDSVPAILDPIQWFGSLGFDQPGGTSNCFDDLPRGACCLPNGTCGIMSADDCANQGGQYQGDGTICDPNNCVAVGACCLPDGTCVIEFISDCGFDGGTFLGPDTACDPGLCAPVGACCFPDGHCEVLRSDDCADAGGEFDGAMRCAPNPCLPVAVHHRTWGEVKATFR